MQQDANKTNTELLDELRELRRRNAELEALVSNLKENEERLQAIASYSYDWENWSGLDGELIWVNPAVEKITGYSVEEYLQLPDRLNQIILDEDRDRILRHFESGTKKQQVGNDIEFRLKCKDGSIKWASVSYQPIYTEKGECLGLRSSIRDISKHKLAEQALQEREERFRSVAESSSDAILITDQNSAIIFWNKAAEKMFGYEAKGILGKSYNRLLPKRLRDQDQKAGQAFLETGILPNNKQPLETVALKKGGSEFPVEITFSNWKAQDQYFFSFIMRDISEHKQSMGALKESEERFKAIAESSPDAIITADSSGKILYWNKAAETIYGYRANEIVGKSIELLRPEEKRLVDRKNREKYLKSGHSDQIGKTVEGLACRKDGTKFISETSTSYWKAGDQLFFSGIVRDITERKRAEKTIHLEKHFSDTVINSLPGIFYLMDKKGRFIRWNKNLEEVTGHSNKTLQNLNALNIIHEDERALVENKIMDVFNTGHTEVEARLVDKKGTSHYYLFTGRRMAIGEHSYLTGLGIEITELKQMEQELQKAHDELEKKVKQRTAELRKANKELQNSRKYLKKYAGILLSVREEEQKNISTTLHDELGCMALSIDSQISIAKEECNEGNKKATFTALEKAQAALRKAVRDLRRLAVDLRPPNLEIVGLTAALIVLIDRAKQQAKLKITLRNELSNKEIKEDKAIVIYRVIQEALTNITKHAKAKNVRVRLYSDRTNINLELTDDGVGFNQDKVTSRKGKLKIGIQGMRERVESLGGELIIKTAPKKGTQIIAGLPKK